MKTNKIISWYATLGPVGYFPASGTMATAVTALFVYCFPVFFTNHAISILMVCTMFACLCINKIIDGSSYQDPSEVVIDEVIGCLITLYGIPVSLVNILLGFLLFRFFDITKIGPVGMAEKVPGAAGILLDDIVAGLISTMILRLLVIYVI